MLFQGLGVVCNKKGGFGVDDFVIEFFGEVCSLLNHTFVELTHNIKL
jgi:hypothetical protein